MKERKEFAEFIVGEFLPYICKKNGKDEPTKKEKKKIFNFLAKKDYHKMFFYLPTGKLVKVPICELNVDIYIPFAGNNVISLDIYNNYVFKKNVDRNYCGINNKNLTKIVKLYFFSKKYLSREILCREILRSNKSKDYFRQIKKIYLNKLKERKKKWIKKI